MGEIEQAIGILETHKESINILTSYNLSPSAITNSIDLAIQALQEKLEREEGFEFESSRRDREDRCKHRCCNICDRLRQEKAERESPKPLISDVDGWEMLCPHCDTDLMGEFSDPDEEKYCPFCGGAVDFRKALCGRKLVKE